MMNGCISAFEERIPTDEELLSCERIVMISPYKWEPYASRFSDEEECTRSKISNVNTRDIGAQSQELVINNITRSFKDMVVQDNLIEF